MLILFRGTRDLEHCSGNGTADDVIFLKRFVRGNQANPDFTLANGDYRLDVGGEAYYASASG
jgi:hypothetical protein